MQNDPDELWKPPGPMDFLMEVNDLLGDKCEKCEKCERPKKECKCRDKSKCDTGGHTENSCEVMVEEDVCVEAKITVKPTLDVGKIKIECIETNVEKIGKMKGKCQDECTAFINQVIRVKIPLKFTTCVDAHKTGIICNPCITKDDCDC